MVRTNFDMERLTKKQHLLLAIRAAVVTGEKEELPDLVQEYRACKANACMRAHKQYNININEQKKAHTNLG